MQTNASPQPSKFMVTAGRLPLVLVAVAGFLAFILVLFSDFIPTPFGGYAAQRLFLTVLCGLLVITPVLSFGFKPLVSTSTALAVALPTLILGLAFLLLSAPFHPRPYVWVEPGMYAFFFLATVASGAYLFWSGSEIAYARILVLIIAATCLIYGLTSVNVYLFALFDGITNLTGFIPWGFVNIRYWSHIATWCLPLMPLAVLVGPLKSFRSWRIAVLLGAGMWWWILFLTTGRGSALGILFGVTFAGLLFGRRAFPWLKVFLAYFLTGIFIWLLLSVVIPSFLADGVQLRTLTVDSSGRMALFTEAVRMSLQNIPFGMGPQSWLTHETLTVTYAAVGKFGHPHNMYLMWAAEYGWVLIAAIGLVVLQAIRYFWKSRASLLASLASEASDEKLLLLTGFTASVSAALFHAGVSAVFMAPGSMLAGLFVLIAFWALIIPTKPGKAPEIPRQKRSMSQTMASLVLCVALIVGWLAWVNDVWGYYQDMREDEELYYEGAGEGTLPRFWFHGNFPR